MFALHQHDAKMLIITHGKAKLACFIVTRSNDANVRGQGSHYYGRLFNVHFHSDVSVQFADVLLSRSSKYSSE